VNLRVDRYPIGPMHGWIYVHDSDSGESLDTTPEALLAALADAGVLYVDIFHGLYVDIFHGQLTRYVSPWTSVNPRDARTGNLKEAK